MSAAPTRQDRRRLLQRVESVIPPVVVFALWWWVSADSSSIYFPPLSAILAAIRDGFVDGPLMGYMLFSLRNLAVGLVVACTLGVAVGLVIGEFELLRRSLDPLLQFARATPQVGLVPLIIGALGLGVAPKIYVIALACFWPVLLNTIDGVRGVPAGLRDVVRAYQIPTRVRWRHVVLMSAMPQIIAGIRVTLAVSVVLMVVSEFYGATSGVGFFIQRSGRQFAVTDAWAGTLVVGALGYALSSLFRVAERRVLGWYFASSGLQSTG